MSDSVFKRNGGFDECIGALHEEIRALYLSDDVPWIIGYSGGKDSTAILQLIWGAVAGIPVEKRHKAIDVISTDTLVENPVVASWVGHSLEVMREQAALQKMPFVPHRLTPAVGDTFWVNLIGKGYPAPRHKFRWCTERLKIKPSNTFITNKIKISSEAVLVLGTRKAESSRRHANMVKLEAGRVRERLSPNASLPGSLVYTPIEDWSNDDVWMFLMQVPNPWGYSNRELMGMYAGATADGECPLVVDTSTPSCGDSRFGCWVCTLVEEDKSMSAMIRNDAEKEWMLPLLEIRNLIDFRKHGAAKGDGEEERADRDMRDYRRMNGSVQLFFDRVIPGPYLKKYREMFLERVLTAQETIRKAAPAGLDNFELLTMAELKEIRRIWVIDKHEIEDSLPGIYFKCTGRQFPFKTVDDSLTIGAAEMGVLREVCGSNEADYEMTRTLISMSAQGRTGMRRAKIHDDLTKCFRRYLHGSEDEALSYARNLEAEKARHNADGISPGNAGQDEVQ